MTRMHGMAFRMYLPTLACLVLAFVSTWWLSDGEHAAYGIPVGDALRWLPYGLLALAAVLCIVASARLMRWEVSGALICGCGGLLGSGRVGRLGVYRKCIRCGRKHATMP